MRIIELGQSAIEAPSAITIGKFDGVHLGHRALLARTRALADEIGGKAGVVTFDRHPLEVLRPGSAPPYLSPLSERLGLLAESGMDFCILLRLERDVLALPAARFVDEIIVQSANARHVVTGEDFRYGRDRAGDIGTLRASGEVNGFQVDVVAPVTIAGRRVSSYAVRNALVSGDLELAHAMLGRRYSVAGSVQKGRQLGRTIGFPTANVGYDSGVVLPSNGIYAVTADWGEGERGAVASLGVRPTVESGLAPVWLEVYIPGWDGDLYDRRVRVTFVKRLRDEVKFESLDALKAQIARDVDNALLALI